jgi:type IV pilus modification protein PilV
MMAQRISTRAPRREAGFSLIEALISLLVVAFGLLGIASFQYTLSRASDVAKQRTEATRIAQREVDRLRSFGQRQADNVADTRYTYVEDVISAAAQTVVGVTTNTTYTMTRTIGVPSPAPASGDRFRWINVVVDWFDRTGQAQSVRLATVISDGDPSDLGPLGVARRLSATLRPKNRNINVPYPAVNVASCPSGSANGCSAFVPPPGNVAYVFDNVTGNVVQSCALTQYPITALVRAGTTATADASGHPFIAGSFVSVSGASPAGYNGEFRVGSIVSGVSFSYGVQSGLTTPATVTGAIARWALIEGIDLANLPGGITCTTYSNEAYLLSGYVRFVTSGTPNADDIINTNGDTFDLLSTGPLSITTSAGDAPSGYTCYAQRQKVVSASNVRGEVIATNGYSRVGNVVTITTTRNHSFTPGMVIAVTGTSNYVLQGQFEIISTPTNRTLTYAEIGADTTASGGRVELIQQLTVGHNDPVPSAYSGQPVSTFVAYTCVVTPSTTGTPREWWGRLDLVPETDPALEEWSTSTHRVCRYTADYNGNGLTNSDHPRYYRQVTGTLDNQNFVVIPAAATCPTDTAPTFIGNQAGDFNNTNTAAHQPTPSDSPGEPNSPNTPILME